MHVLGTNAGEALKAVCFLRPLPIGSIRNIHPDCTLRPPEDCYKNADAGPVGYAFNIIGLELVQMFSFSQSPPRSESSADGVENNWPLCAEERSLPLFPFLNKQHFFK